MPFIIGLIIGALATFMVVCIIASKKIDEAYMEGYNAGRKDGYIKAFNEGRDYEHAVGRFEDDCK